MADDNDTPIAPAPPPLPIDMSDVPQQAVAQPTLAPQPVQGVSRLPGVAGLVANLIHPPTQVQVNPKTQMSEAQRTSRLDVFEKFLGNFLYAFGQGMSQSGTGPGANIRGAGAAITAPVQLEMQQQKLAQERQLTQSQSDEAQARAQYYSNQSQMVDTPYGPLPAVLARSMFPSLINTQSREKVAGARLDYDKARDAKLADLRSRALDISDTRNQWEKAQGSAKLALQEHLANSLVQFRNDSTTLKQQTLAEISDARSRGDSLRAEELMRQWDALSSQEMEHMNMFSGLFGTPTAQAAQTTQANATAAKGRAQKIIDHNINRPKQPTGDPVADFKRKHGLN